MTKHKPKCMQPRTWFHCLPVFSTVQWRVMAAHKAQQREKVAGCLGKLFNRQQLKAFNQWHGYTEYR